MRVVKRKRRLLKGMKNAKLDCIEQLRSDFISQFVDFQRKNGLSNEELGKMIGCNSSYISILTSKTRPLKIETMVKVLGSLGFEVHMKIVNPRLGRKKLVRD